MEVELGVKSLFPDRVETLLISLSSVGFFADGLMVGSWVWPVYREVFGVSYPLRTFDLDFAIPDAPSASAGADLEAMLQDLGYVVVTDYRTGLRKFTKEGFSVEFFVHRRGGREKDKVENRNWNVSALPLPFVDILFFHPISVQFRNYKIRIPCPEALFIHKLIIAQRRASKVKRENDLAQCKALMSILDEGNLRQLMGNVKAGSGTLKQIKRSCEEIGFPPQKLGK